MVWIYNKPVVLQFQMEGRLYVQNPDTVFFLIHWGPSDAYLRQKTNYHRFR